MSDNLMPEHEAILHHLTHVNFDNDRYNFFSGFMAGMRDARKFTGRNQDTGEKLANDNCGDHGSWLGAIGYMAILDQIGTCFKPRNYPPINNVSSIQKVLQYFSGLPPAEIDAIYALRNAFAHDFSLYNININRPSLQHFFKVTQSPIAPIVRLPQNQWDGTQGNKNGTTETIINLEALGDMVESIREHLIQLAENNNLEVILPNGSDDLLNRYSFYSMK